MNARAQNWGRFGAGAAIGSVVSGPVGAVVFHRDIPVETLDWIVSHGFVGFLLVSLSLLGGFALAQLARNGRLEREYREKIEALMREQVVLIREVTNLGGRVADVAEKIHQEQEPE